MTTTPTITEINGIEFGLDGNMMTAVRPGFRNLMEDNCGFGKTHEEAIFDLCRQEGKPPIEASHEIASYQATQKANAVMQPVLPEMASGGEGVAKRKGKAHQKYFLQDGTQVPGVTSALNIINKPFLIPWANKLGLQGIDSTKYVDALAHIGTIAHYLIECDLYGIEPYLRDFSPNDVEAAKRSVSSWYAWRRGKEIVPILHEAPMVSEVHRYGGTIDHFCLIDGVRTLLDVKTSKAIYGEHLLQVAAYKVGLEENDHPVDETRIVRVGREEGEGFEDKLVDQLDKRFEAFLHALALHNLQKQLRF
jgi:hypothetical protein